MYAFYRHFNILLFTIFFILVWSQLVYAQNSGIIAVVAQGDPTPIGGTFSFLSDFSFNDAGTYAFEGDIDGGTASRGIFVAAGGSVSLVAANGDSVFVDNLPDSIPNIVEMFVGGFGVSLNNSGAVAFGGSIAYQDTSNIRRTASGVFITTSEGISNVVLSGAPGPAGGTFTSPYVQSNSLNNFGALAFQDNNIQSNIGYLKGIFIYNGISILKVVAGGDPTPIGGVFEGFELRDFNDIGTALFSSNEISGGSGSLGLFTGEGETISKVVAGDPVPGGILFPGVLASINNSNEVSFTGSIFNNTTGESTEGLFLLSNGEISTIANEDTPVPGGGGKFFFFNLPSINDARQIAFTGTLNEFFGPAGIYFASSGVIEKIILEGEPTPLGGTLESIRLGVEHQINSGGAVAFYGRVSGNTRAYFLWGGALIAVSPDSVAFDIVEQGDTTRVDIEVRSVGSEPLRLQQITALPSPPFGLENLPNLPLTLQPGQNTQFTIFFAPTETEGNSNTTANNLIKLEDGQLTITSDALNSPSTIKLIEPVVVSAIVATVEPPEVKAGELATISAVVLDQNDNLNKDFEGNVRLRLLKSENESTPGIGRLSATLSLVEEGVSDNVFFSSPEEPFAGDKPITFQTVLSGKAFVEVRLEDSNIPPDTVEINVKSPLDFFVETIDIQQGVIGTDKEVMQEFKPGEIRSFPALPFIADHNTTVRVFVDYENTVPIEFSSIEEIVGITSELNISLNGNVVVSIDSMKTGGRETRQYQLKDTNGDGEVDERDYDILVELEDLRNALFTFISHDKLGTPGTYTFETELKFSNLDEVASEKENNKKTIEATFVGTNTLKILAGVGVLEGSTFPEVPEDIWNFLKNAYPIQHSKFIVNDANLEPFSFTESFFDFPIGTVRFAIHMSRVLDRHNKENPQDQRDKIFIFTDDQRVIDEVCTDGAGGCTKLNGRAGIGFIRPSTAAHELGHNLGLRDTYKTDKFSTSDGEPNPRRSNAINSGNFVEFGNIQLIDRKQILPTNPHFDFMGSGNSWVDRVTWNHLYQTKFRIGSQNTITLASTNGFISVSAIINENDTVVFSSFITLPQIPEVPASQEGDYSLEFEDSGGALLSDFEFDVEFHIPEVGDVSEVPFSFTLPLPENASRVVMKKNGVELASRTFSTNPPVVELISPTSGDTISGVSNIEWTASDPDDDELTYDILYSPDGRERIVVNVNRTETSYEWDSSLVPPSSSALITVIANDGINEGEAAAGPLIVRATNIIRGDVNGDSKIDIADVVFLISYILGDGPAPNPFAAGDANEDGAVDIADVVFLINLILGG